MKKVLVLNCGSSSIKYQLYDNNYKTLVEGLIERIGESEPRLIHEKNGKELKRDVKVKNHKQGIKLMLELLHDDEWGAIKRVTEISVVGHRVVHGGQMDKSALVSDVALGYLEDFQILAPLHNPHNITGIKEAKKAMPTVPQVMVFDTEFHQTMPRKAYMYGLPYQFFDKYAVRKYGFHGMSHKYVSLRSGELLKKRKPNVITCHMGNGVSLTAVKNGESVDTSMGMTPLEGVMMGTRTGDFDPSVLQYLVKRYKKKYDELFEIANHKSGLLGISGVSKDMRVIHGRAKKGNERCKLAKEVYCYRIAKYIGSYAVALKKVDAIVFTAGAGMNAPYLRSEICDYLKIIGVKLDERKNKKAIGKEAIISSNDSKIKVFVIPTDEELMIARQAVDVISK